MMIEQECCNSPYGNQYFSEYAEEIPGTSTEAYSKAASENGVYLIAGWSVSHTETESALWQHILVKIRPVLVVKKRYVCSVFIDSLPIFNLICI